MRVWTRSALLAGIVASGLGSAASAAIIADSVADFPAAGALGGKQNTAGWVYGYHNVNLNGAYAAGDFIAFHDNVAAGTSATDFWTGSGWDWHSGNPPWDDIGPTGMHPNGSNQPQGEHWVIRRYVVEAADLPGVSDVNVNWTLKKINLSPTGNGVSGVVFHNGAAVDAAVIAAANGTGVTRNVVLKDAKAGDFIDIVLTPAGTDGAHGDGSDSTAMTSVISTVPRQVGGLVADSQADFTGIQGVKNWHYGYYDRSADGNTTYNGGSDFTAMLGGITSPGPWGDANHWNGSSWDFNPLGASNGNPPWTTIGATSMHPNDFSPGAEHYAVRRWISEVNGIIDITGFLNRPATVGDGTFGRIYLNGVEVWSSLTLGNTISFNLQLLVQKGDQLDMLVDVGPNRGSAGADGNDSTNFAMRIVALPEPITAGLVMLGLAPLALRRRRA